MAAVAPSSIPSDLVDSLGFPSPRDALLSLADESERTAARLAAELAASLSGSGGNGNGAGGPKHGVAISPSKPRKAKPEEGAVRKAAFPLPLPKSLGDAPRPSAPPSAASTDGGGSSDSNGDNNGGASTTTTKRGETPSRTLHKSHPAHPLTHACLASESILSSLSRIASGGSAASSEMRALESQRREVDAEASDLEHALAIRDGCARGGDSLMGRRYGDAARAAADVNAILEGTHGGPKATERAKELAGTEALAAHARTTEVLKRAVGERYEAAVQHGDVAGLSELTPLLGMLGMAELGVKLYLQYSQSVLCHDMDMEPDDVPVDMSNVPREEGMSRAAMRRRAEERKKMEQTTAAPAKLARIYNAAVTHLRHHLPMVAYALGEADGDAALVQLVHVEAEKRAVDILREYMAEREVGRTVRRAEGVAAKIEDRYAGGGGVGGSRDEMDGLFGGMGGAGDLLGLGAGGDLGGGAGDAAQRRAAAQMEDCGFAIEVGHLSDVDAALEEWALVMQHTESYERFVRHAVEEVVKARKLRREQRREEKRRQRELEEANQGGDAGAALASPRKKHGADLDDDEAGEEGGRAVEILPPHTALNEVAAEIGGCCSSLERCLLLASMQRAFVRAAFPDESTFAPVAAAGNAAHGAGAHALQTSLVEECLFAARRSTLRAFATGHVGTASAAANVCVDVLGRILLEVLQRRAEWGASLVKPGEGLLDGPAGAGVGHAALSLGKGLRGAAARAGAAAGDSAAEGMAVRRRRALLVARAAANFNDLAVAAEYARRLEANFLREIDAGYPPGHDTEQLRMCVRGLGGAADAYARASARAVEGLVATVLPRARQVVNEAVGQEGGSAGAASAATNFLGGPVLTGGAAGVAHGGLEYDLDEAAFELAQISEGYIGRVCSGLDELIFEPLRVHLVPKLSDDFVIGILGGVSKRLEAAIRKSKFTPLGAISLDSDIRYLMTFAKDRIDSPELKSNVTLCKACPPLARLNQITLLLNVDDLEDALDLISVSKRKGNWDLKLDDAKSLLSLRTDFEGSKVNDLLQVEED